MRAPVLPQRVKLEILKALRTSPASVLACLLNGLILTGFFTVGPLFGDRIGFDQQHIVLLMACVSLGGLFLQWPIGYFSDKVDRLYALIGLGSEHSRRRRGARDGRSAARPSRCSRCCLQSSVDWPRVFTRWASRMRTTAPCVADYVALSSTLLFVWALGAAIGPTTGTYAIQLISPHAFFVYVIALTLAFTLFAVWRLYRRKLERVVEVHEDFLAYPQTSPEIYAWLPYHRETPGEADAATGAKVAPGSELSQPER